MNKTFIKRLNSLGKDISKAAFARKCDIKQTTMIGYLNGTSEPNLENLQKIAKANDVKVSWLIGEDKKVAQGISLERHKEIGKELKIMYNLLLKIQGEFYSSYPKKGKLARPLKEIAKAIEANVNLRHYAEENMYEDVGKENFDTKIYYGSSDLGDSLLSDISKKGKGSKTTKN